MEKQNKAWEMVQNARSPERLKPQDFVFNIFPDFMELHGDRYGGDDKTIMGGLATLNGEGVTVIATRKGTDLKSNMEYRFGMPSPEGYRKSLRLMRQAEKFHRPIITFVDTPGAYPGIEAEDHGISAAIAQNLYEMSALQTPIIAIITGEGGSGGALALLVADRTAILENSFLSVISPEGCASILFKDSAQAPLAAESLRLDSQYLAEKQIVQQIFSESASPEQLFAQIRDWISAQIAQIKQLSTAEMLAQRFATLSAYGEYHEVN
ncbi:MAG: acetyl-CoA carboxylase carboxyl transferase subunit alpha [Fibrobacter sp.]|nr:acetyl-CoA carboxylase carboxyl transferase subunit alpha [Fibrobacter sp.]